MSNSAFLFLFVSVLARTCYGNARHFAIPKLKKGNPFGVGFQSAVRQNSLWSPLQRQTSTSYLVHDCQENDQNQSRFASIYKDEAEALGVTAAPYLKNQKRVEISDDPFHPEYEGILASTVNRVTPPAQEEVGQKIAQPAITATTDVPAGGMMAVRPLVFWENMICGAISRSVAQTVMHPANTMKTILQSSRGADRPTLRQLMRADNFKLLTRGAGANFILSVPHGAVNFAVLELVRGRLAGFVRTIPYLEERIDSIGPGLDFMSSAISTICCSVVSTPQMMITDNIMAGNYPRLTAAIRGLHSEQGLLGFYAGWWPGLVGKIPSYALTWTFFQQLKRTRDYFSDRPAKNFENTIMGSIASAATVCIMMPMDTVKTRLVTQLSSKTAAGVPYKGIVNCAVRITREEGVRTFYRGLAPRLLSVVPMIALQFTTYEAMKRFLLQREHESKARDQQRKVLEQNGEEEDPYGSEEALEEAAMEVAASLSNPLPAPHFMKQSNKLFPKKKGKR